MKNIKYIVFTLIICLLNLSFVKANTIDSINVEVTLDKNGNAEVTEIWHMNVDEGTEVYKPMSNLGNSNITDYTVSMDSSNFTTISPWNTSASFSSKSYKAGINYTSSGLELCFGMTSYGTHTYTLKYKVTNMIYNVNDAQVLYWKFINDSMDPATKSFSVLVSGPTTYTDDLPVWGYGYKGYAYVSNGRIYMSNTEDHTFKSTEYAVLLVEFPLNTFTTTNSIAKYSTFDDFNNAAKEGSYSSKDDDTFETILSIILSIGPIIIISIIIIMSASKSTNYIKNKINMKDVNNFRDIPCNKNILEAYFLSKVYGLNKAKEDIFGAALLKWLLDGTVTIEEKDKKGLFKTKKVTSINMTKDIVDNTPLGELYNMLKTASRDGILDCDEFESWAKNNYSKVYSWFDNVETYVRNNDIQNNTISSIKKGKVFSSYSYEISPSLEEEAIHLAGLKKYLIEFSKMNEKQPIEVHLWEYYLIYAQIFGIAKEVSKQFKDLYPELLEQSNYQFDYTDVILMDNFYTTGVNAMSAARAAAESYHSGGGGFSSFGGGGGSFGGGSGGGCR